MVQADCETAKLASRASSDVARHYFLRHSCAGRNPSRPTASFALWQGQIKQPAVYILASQPNGTLYVGVTSALFDRVIDHRAGTFGGFTAKHGIKTLVYYETFDTMDEAIRRETRLKAWKRLWKIRLIEQVNPTWADLFDLTDGVRNVGPAGQSEQPHSG
jgi:putative endonuclease